ncbi:MAG: PEP-CTERM sorting domain-containing protein [Akkermansiaceae bacterium]
MKLLLKFLTFGVFATSVQAESDYSISFANYLSGTSFDSPNSFDAGDWYDGLDGLVYSDVIPDSEFDVGAILVATSVYTPHTESLNGNNGGDDAFINMKRDNSVDFSFTLYDTATGNIVDTDFFGEDFKYSLVFYDLDGSPTGGLEQITSYDHSSWQKLETSIIDVVEDGNTATATTNGSNNNVPNAYAETTNLTEEQQSAAIVFDYENKGSIDLTYTIVGGATNNQRNLFIDADDFTVFTLPTETSTVPEPSSALLIGMSSLFLISRRKR